MSFDEYAEHIYQKHRLGVAIALLKTKPPDITSIQYLEQLKSKMADKMDDDDVTICSEDFVLDDDDSINILKDYHEGDDNEMIENSEYGIGNEECNVNKEATPNTSEQHTQSTYFNSSQSQPSNIRTNNDVTYYETPIRSKEHNHITTNIPTNNEENTEASTFFSNINELSTKKIDVTNIANNHIAANSLPSNSKVNDTYFDSQKTILYTVPAFQNNTHYSASQAEMVIPTKYIHGVDKNIPVDSVKNVDKSYKTLQIINNVTLNSNTTVEDLNTTNINNKIQEVKPKPVIKDNIPNGTNTQNETFSQRDNSMYSNQNYMNNMGNIKSQINDKNDHNKDNVPSNLQEQDYSQNFYEYFAEIQNFVEKERFEYLNNENTLSLQYGNERITRTVPNFDNSQTQLDINFEENQETDGVKDKATDNNMNLPENTDLEEKITQHNESLEDVELVEEESKSVEVIPYKVLGELNKVKTFLRRRDRRMSCDGFSSDSGYRSDSQNRSSNRSTLQLSGISMNQSAYSLLNHIVQCPLVDATRDITAEIAQALGDLINRLHDEETYPPFLEELLDTVDILLRQVFKGSVSDYTEFLKKDEFLERLIFLNKSIHIQKHTITKITDTLTKFHEKLTDENNTYELTNIDEVENSCYIFDILEILLKKYIKNKTLSSQSNTQLSQDEEKVLKKSTLTDIWRRKWNPNLKEVNEGSRENRCVLKSCSDILNKIVVDCVHSYSLVAFSALKCFNSMQT